MTETYTDAARGGVDSKLPDIETFEYQYPDQHIDLTIHVEEFTSICPKTGLPDFGTIEIKYIPDKLCLELKSLKFYFLAYRNLGVFYEHGTVKILDDLFRACQPVHMIVKTKFSSRGGLHSESWIERWKDREKVGGNESDAA